VDHPNGNPPVGQRVTAAFVARGYQLVDSAPDLAVAFYASAHETLDVTVWDYGFPFRPRWPQPMYQQMVTEVTEGSVVVDVIDPRSRELLWRGEGKARLSADPAENVKELARVAAEVVKKFPAVRR